jgi:predicted O-methyltransferase YrrM
MPAILTEETAKYLAAMQPPADDLVEEVEAHAERERIPIASRSVAHLQAILARATDADRVLEFGTAIGYSTLHVARTGAEVVTMDVDEERIAAAEEYLERGGVRDRVHIHHAPALDVLDDVDGPFELVFIDALNGEYEQYLERSLPMVPEGGLVVADNLLWDGSVPADDADVDPARRESTAALRAFNEVFLNHDRLDAIISPLGDGTGIATKVD